MRTVDAVVRNVAAAWAVAGLAGLAGVLVAGCDSSAPASEARRGDPGGSPSSPSLPQVASGHRPGPDILYAGPADVPQLQNAGIWKAEPILVSGAVAYRRGEFLYQDFLYDDHGAAGVPDPNAPVSANAFLFSPSAGTFTYPTDPAYVNNAADLVEFRVKPLGDATAFRVTLNSLTDPALVAFTLALGGDAAKSAAWPHGAGVSSPADVFLTVHGDAAELADTSGTTLATLPASLDLARRQYEVRVPRSAWDPGQGKVRMTIGVGLWSGAGYLAPSGGSATATAPGGAAPTGAAIVNVGPRLAEPFPDLNDPTSTWTLGDSAVGAAEQARWWRERMQADQLRLGDVSPFYADVDFARLAAGVDDDSQVPSKGPINRILASHYQFGQGHDPSKVCFDLASQFSAGAQCIGRFLGQLQPYALYIPDKPQPSRGWGMTLLLHSLSANFNQYAGSNNMSQLGERGAGSLVITPAGRGPDGFYAGMAEADTFEVWADVARRYKLDPDWSVVSGYSMGGFGTYRLLARWPDLFARGFSVVGIPGSADPMLAGLRNTPLLAWNAVADELVRIDQSEAAEQHLAALGLRFVEWLFPSADHLTLATNDEYGPGAEFLGSATVDRDPPHVTFVVNPAEDNAQATAVADHAYWLSGITLRDPAAGSPATGTIDVRSQGFGVADATPTGVAQGGGALVGGNHAAMPYVSREQGWGEAAPAPFADALDIVATNVASVTIDPVRARVSCDARLDVQSDGPIAVVLEGCGSRKVPR